MYVLYLYTAGSLLITISIGGFVSIFLMNPALLQGIDHAPLLQRFGLDYAALLQRFARIDNAPLLQGFGLDHAPLILLRCYNATLILYLVGH